MRLRSIVIALLLSILPASAQFYTTGADPAAVRWYHFHTRNYDIIFPQGTDSLARVYAASLECHRDAVGRSIGVKPNGAYGGRMPVVLHSYRADANGVVTWAPRRMELYTTQGAIDPEPLEWITDLTIHESRHVSQMQIGRSRVYKPLYWLTGEMATGALSALYGGPAFFEGDAVTAETALTDFGRGRSADFLEAMRVAWDQGDRRDWYQWRYGSIRRYAPDYYKAGYMLVAGMRSTYDDPLFTSRFYESLDSRRVLSFPVNNLGKTMKAASGKRFRATWDEIYAHFGSAWEANIEARGPFDTLRLVTAVPERFTSYRKTTGADSCLFTVRSGLADLPHLLRIDADGSEQDLGLFSASTSRLAWAPASGRLYWSEIVPGERWEMEGSSRIRYISKDGGTKYTITRKGRFYNPAASPSDHRISVTEYPLCGGSAVCVMDGDSGEVLARYPAPDGLQVVETAWMGERIYASGISSDGFGIYEATDGFAPVLQPQKTKMKQLVSHDGRLHFICDINGVDEVYALDGGSLIQLTNTRYGVSDFAWSGNGDEISFSQLSLQGRLIGSAAPLSIARGEGGFDSRYEDPVAACLTRQENALAATSGSDSAIAIEISEPQRYRKALHPLRLHSWAPIYFNYDNIQNLSFDNIAIVATPGATVLFQNTLGTVSGFAGWSAAYYGKEGWQHSGHAKVTWSGLYPVIEASLDINDRNAYAYSFQHITHGGAQGYAVRSRVTGSPLVSSRIKMYVPLRFSSSGWNRGIVPQISYSITNDMFDNGQINLSTLQVNGQDGGNLQRFQGYEKGSRIPMQRMVATVRAYAVTGTPEAGVYPRWGGGVECGWGQRVGLEKIFSPALYGYAYAYLPGFSRGHGIKVSAMGQRLTDGGRFRESYVYVMPRGFSGAAGKVREFADEYPSQVKCSFDYKMAVLPVDWSALCPAFYIRNFELGAHFDSAFYTGREQTRLIQLAVPDSAVLWSAGGSVAVRMENFLWLPFPSTIGTEVSYNGGSGHRFMAGQGNSAGNWYASLIFNIDF